MRQWFDLATADFRINQAQNRNHLSKLASLKAIGSGFGRTVREPSYQAVDVGIEGRPKGTSANEVRLDRPRFVKLASTPNAYSLPTTTWSHLCLDLIVFRFCLITHAE